MTVILVIVSIFLFLCLVCGGYVFIKAFRRNKEMPWLIEEEIKKTNYGKYYECMVDADNWLKDNYAQDVYITAEDGIKLHGLWVKAENPRGTLLFAHGYRSTPLLDFGVALPFYHELGFNILLPHQRAHGKSEAKYITFGVKECKDMLGWIQYHNENYGTNPIILSGMSMGASTMLFLADEPLPDNVKGIVADCGFTSPRDILSCVFTNVTHLPAGLVLWSIDLFARLFAGVSLSQKDTRKTLQKNKLQVFFVHGRADDFVPCWMSEAGFDACAGNKELFLVENAGHGVSFLVAPDAYRDKLIRFIDNILNR